MNLTESFLTPSEEQSVVEAIRKAEKNTSGEIRVHLENKSITDPLQRAKEVFNTLKMYETEARNGVLFYVSVAQKHFAIIGDSGIDAVVPYNFWDEVKNTVISYFIQKKYEQGLTEGILKTGEKLKQYFPTSSTNTNELSDEISKG